MDSRMQDTPNDVYLKRDHDSLDDFEHLDGSPDDHSEQQHRRVVIDASVPRVDDLLHINTSFQTPNSVLLSAVSDDFDDEIRPVPATPPPSADFEKCEVMAQSSDPFQQSLEAVDPKLSSMAFVESERSYPTTMHQVGNNDGIGMNLISDMTSQVPLLPTSFEPTRKTDIDFLVSDMKTSKAVSDKKVPPIEKYQDIKTSGNWDEGEIASARSTRDVDEIFTRDIRSSIQPIPERSPVIDFLRDDNIQKEDKIKNIMDDDSWNVVEKTDLKREQMKEHEPPMKPLPPSPKQSEFLDNPYLSKYDTSNDFLLTESGKDKPPVSLPSESERASVKRREGSRRDAPSTTISARLAGKKNEEIEIAPKEIFRDMGLGKYKKKSFILEILSQN